jgi:hypothetical protein
MNTLLKWMEWEDALSGHDDYSDFLYDIAQRLPFKKVMYVLKLSCF